MATKKPAVESAAPAADKKKALETAMAQIERNYGKGSIMRLGENLGVMVESIPTGSLSLDLALGIGGLPKGRIIEVYGPESSGKTTLALHVVAEAQKRGGEVAFIDAEHALDPTYARALGVDIDSMLISQPDTGEQGLEICEALVRSGAIDVVVVDSVAALTPRAEIEGDMGDSHVGLLARLMSQALRKLAGSIAKTNCIVIFINQLREKVGVVYGNPEVTTGGRALTEEEAERLQAAVRTGGLKEKALNLLAGRPMSRRELERKLESWEAAPEEATAICGRLEELGFLNDALYAEQVVRHYSAKGYGLRKLRDELYRRGVPRELWDEALERAEDPAEAIDAFLAKKLGDTPPEDRRAWKRASDALARRGYAWSDISEGLRRYGAEWEE